MSTKQITHVIFDWAGTTVDYGSMAPALALLKAFQRRGVELSMQEARGPMGIKKDEHVRAILSLPQVMQKFAQAQGRIPSESDAQEIYADLDRLLDQVVEGRTDLIPGHLEFVTWLRTRGCLIGSTTGYTRRTMGIVLSAAERQGYVPDCDLTPSEARGGRPAPWMIWQILERLACVAAWKCIKFGDTPADMQEGRNAGTWCVGYSTCGNAFGLSLEELQVMPPSLLKELQRSAENDLLAAGAHLVITGPQEGRTAFLHIEEMLAEGKRP